MDGILSRIIASVVCACFYLVCTEKAVSVMQQCGYKNGVFLKWFSKKENSFFKRLLAWSVLSLFAVTITAFCFSFLGAEIASAITALPFFCLAFVFYLSDRKYALKVKATPSGRWKRLALVYLLFSAILAFLVVSLCSFIATLFLQNGGSEWWYTLRYLPVSLLPLLLPFTLCLANACTGIFENVRNRKFVKRAGQVLDESKIIRVGVVGSYGKTSVKNILNTILSVKYNSLSSPASYNTPVGIAKTVFSPAFDRAEVFVAEMGARKEGDIAELCALVKPQYIAFTGVCAQHVQTFGGEDGVLKTKCEALKSGAKVVCGSSLKDKINSIANEFSTEELSCVSFVEETAIKELDLQADKTTFTLVLKSGEIEVETVLLGASAAENIALAAYLAEEMGLTKDEIAHGISLVEPVPHRLQLIRANGLNILDDGYNANEKGAAIAIDALKRFDGKKVVVTPGIVETGVLEETINGKLGALLADEKIDRVILVGETLVLPVKKGYVAAGGDEEKLSIVSTLEKAQFLLGEELVEGDAVLFLNDLPDVY